jgi:hypothetical protein
MSTPLERARAFFRTTPTPLERARAFFLTTRAGRIVGVTALACAALEATYLVGANAFLSSKALQGIISADDGTLRLSYDQLWTVVPGRYHVSGLVIAGRSRSTQWQLTIDEASFTCNVFALPMRRFSVSRVDGEGVSFRLKIPKNLADHDAPGQPEQPSIPWYDGTDWPAPDETITPPKERWTVAIAGVTVATRELWVDRFRLSGAGTARGSFRLTPSGGFEVFPSTLHVEPSAISAGGELVASSAEGDLACRIGFFPLPIGDDARALLRRISARATGEAVIAGAEVAASFLPGAQLDDGSGHLHVDATLVEGLFVQGSEARYETDRLGFDQRLTPDGATIGLSGAATIAWQAAAGASTLALTVPSAIVRRSPDESGPDARAPTLEDVSLAVVTGPPQLADELSFTGARARVGSVDVPDVRFLQGPPFDTNELRFVRGSARGGGELAFADGRITDAHARLAANDFTIRVGSAGDVFHAEIAARANGVGGEAPGSVRLHDTRVDLADVKIHAGERDLSRWWAAFLVDDATLAWAPGVSLSGPVRIRAKDAYPALLFALDRDGLPGWLTDHLSTDGLDARTIVSAGVGPTRLEIQVPKADGGVFGTTGLFRWSARTGVCGAFRFTKRDEQHGSTPLALGVAFRQKSREIELLASPDWLANRLARACPAPTPAASPSRTAHRDAVSP